MATIFFPKCATILPFPIPTLLKNLRPLNSGRCRGCRERGRGAAPVAGEIFQRVERRLSRNLYANPRNLGFSFDHKHRDYAIKTALLASYARRSVTRGKNGARRKPRTSEEIKSTKSVAEGKFTGDAGTRYKSAP